jgi:3-oxoacyl-[acyl-carrier protein] reductase
MENNSLFSKKVIIVTGAASGIGRQIAQSFHASGGTVIGCDRDTQGLEMTMGEMTARGGGCHARSLDVRDVTAVNSLADEVFKTFGRIDVLVNCAGICSGVSIADMTEDEWDTTLAVNLKGLFFLSRAVSRVLILQKSGRIINIGSLAGFTGGIMSNAAYSASKAAVTCTTKNFAKYLASHNVMVNEVAPGTAQTSMSEAFLGDRLHDFVRRIPLGRLCQPNDVAAAVLFLASDSAAFITGQTLHVDGGMYM